MKIETSRYSVEAEYRSFLPISRVRVTRGEGGCKKKVAKNIPASWYGKQV